MDARNSYLGGVGLNPIPSTASSKIPACEEMESIKKSMVRLKNNLDNLISRLTPYRIEVGKDNLKEECLKPASSAFISTLIKLRDEISSEANRVEDLLRSLEI